MSARPETHLLTEQRIQLQDRTQRMTETFTEDEISAGSALVERFRHKLRDDTLANAAVTLTVSELATATLAIDKLYMATSFFAAGGPTPGDPHGGVVMGGGSGLGFLGRYDDGVIFWRRDLGAHWVHGAIHACHAALGAESGLLGYPTTEELTTAVAGGRVTHFERGSIYWPSHHRRLRDPRSHPHQMERGRG